ncbi:MAG: thioredoxin family protein [Bacillota bacterium]
MDQESELASQFGIVSIPPLLLFKDGKLIDKMVGVQSKEMYLLKAVFAKIVVFRI